MKISRVLLAVLVVVTFGVLAGCDLANEVTGSQIIGSIIVSNYNWVIGGTKYHVVLYSAGTYMDPYSDYGTVPQAASVEGTFPGSSTDTSDTVNYQFDNVPAGQYSLFAWVDSNGNGSFDSNFDQFGFYFGNPSVMNYTQPLAPDVLVPEKSIVDVGVWVDYYVS